MMANRKVRRVVKRKKTLNLVYFSVFLFSISVLTYLSTSLFLKSFNNNLASEVQSIERKIEELTVSNDALKVNIASLSSKDRVMSVVSEFGLDVNLGNIITITKD